MNWAYRITMLTVFCFIVFLIYGQTSDHTQAKQKKESCPVVQAMQAYKVIAEHDIVYAEGLSHESINSRESKVMPLKLDVYLPDNKSKNRPVFLFIHGGGFAGGTKQQGRIIEWANYYASRGWVFISADYRLKKHKGTVPQEWLDFATQVPNGKGKQFLAMYAAHRDAKTALRWILANANKYKINTDYITVGGGSAGAVTAIGIGVSDHEDFRDEIGFEQDPTLKSTNLDQANYQIRTIVNLWGSKAALHALEVIYGHQRFDEHDPSLFIAHGTEDQTVPFIKAEELQNRYETTGVPYAYYPLEGKGHGAWGAKVNNIGLEELAFDFIVEQQCLIIE